VAAALAGKSGIDGDAVVGAGADPTATATATTTVVAGDESEKSFHGVMIVSDDDKEDAENDDGLDALGRAAAMLLGGFGAEVAAEDS